jgi:hypothetical protein
MSQRNAIKILKRGERERAPVAVISQTDKEDEAPDYSRQIASTVSGWVREFQHRRSGARAQASNG